MEAKVTDLNKTKDDSDIRVAPLIRTSYSTDLNNTCCLHLGSKKPFSIINALSSKQGRPGPPC